MSKKMKSIDRICLIIITLGIIYLSWTLHVSSARLVEQTKISMAFTKDKIQKVMDERNLAEAHVAYLEKELKKWSRQNWKNKKGGGKWESEKQKKG